MSRMLFIVRAVALVGAAAFFGQGYAQEAAAPADDTGLPPTIEAAPDAGSDAGPPPVVESDAAADEADTDAVESEAVTEEEGQSEAAAAAEAADVSADAAAVPPNVPPSAEEPAAEPVPADAPPESSAATAPEGTAEAPVLHAAPDVPNDSPIDASLDGDNTVPPAQGTAISQAPNAAYALPSDPFARSVVTDTTYLVKTSLARYFASASVAAPDQVLVEVGPDIIKPDGTPKLRSMLVAVTLVSEHPASVVREARAQLARDLEAKGYRLTAATSADPAAAAKPFVDLTIAAEPSAVARDWTQDARPILVFAALVLCATALFLAAIVMLRRAFRRASRRTDAGKHEEENARRRGPAMYRDDDDDEPLPELTLSGPRKGATATPKTSVAQAAGPSVLDEVHPSRHPDATARPRSTSANMPSIFAAEAEASTVARRAPQPGKPEDFLPPVPRESAREAREAREAARESPEAREARESREARELREARAREAREPSATRGTQADFRAGASAVVPPLPPQTNAASGAAPEDEEPLVAMGLEALAALPLERAIELLAKLDERTRLRIIAKLQLNSPVRRRLEKGLTETPL